MCEIITIGGRLAHASSLTYRFWGDASREEPLFGVTPRARNRFLGWRLARGIAFWGDASREASPQKMRGVTPTPARSHPENGGMAPHQFFENNFFFRSKPAKGTHCAWRSYGALPSLKNRRFQLFLFLSYCKCGENARSHPDRRYHYFVPFFSAMLRYTLPLILSHHRGF